MSRFHKRTQHARGVFEVVLKVHHSHVKVPAQVSLRLEPSKRCPDYDHLVALATGALCRPVVQFGRCKDDVQRRIHDAQEPLQDDQGDIDATRHRVCVVGRSTQVCGTNPGNIQNPNLSTLLGNTVDSLERRG